MEKGTAAKDVDAYLKGATPDARAALEKLRAAIRAAAPSAEESISYQMPSFKYRGKPLVYFAAFKDHCSLFPASTAVINAHKKELERYYTSKGTIRFTPNKPLPAALVRSIVKARISEVDAKMASRASSRRRT